MIYKNIFGFKFIWNGTPWCLRNSEAEPREELKISPLIKKRTRIKATRCETLRKCTTNNSKNTHIRHTASIYH